MTTPTFTDLLEQLRSEDESVLIEAKEAGAPSQSVMEAVSAFSNEPGRGGGFILFGVRAVEGLFPDYEVVGVSDPDHCQTDLATQSRQMLQPPVRPTITVETHEGKTVVVAHVPEAPPGAKPVYLKSEGLPAGAYRRIGASNQHCTDDDVALLFQGRGHAAYDESPLPGTSVDDIDENAVREYRRLRKDMNPEASELAWSDRELLHGLGATADAGAESELTMAGLLLFGKEVALRRHLPMCRIDYIRVEGKEWVPDPERRYSALELRGALLLVIPRVIAAILDDIPKAFSLPGEGVHRQDVPLIPRTVIREAMVNAVMHRTYRLREPVQVIRYSNRIEIRNPGHSLVPDDRLGEPGSRCRNERIAAVLHEVGLAETKGTGIRTMRAAMEDANLTLPVFESDWQRDGFTVRLLVHHLLGPEDVTWLAGFSDCELSSEEARALIFVRETGAIDNGAYRDVNRVDTLSASQALRRLRDLGLIAQKGKGRATYYVPTEKLVQGDGASASGKAEGESQEISPGDKALSPGLDGVSPGLTEADDAERLNLLGTLPEALQERARRLGKRAAPDDVASLILDLCGHRTLQPAELALILDRNAEYVRKQYLSPLVDKGKLQLTFPDNPAHPKQSYRRRS